MGLDPEETASAATFPSSRPASRAVHVVPPSFDRYTPLPGPTWMPTDATSIFDPGSIAIAGAFVCPKVDGMSPSISVQLEPPSTLFHTPRDVARYTCECAAGSIPIACTWAVCRNPFDPETFVQCAPASVERKIP